MRGNLKTFGAVIARSINLAGSALAEDSYTKLAKEIAPPAPASAIRK